jgi:proteasome lid subunit RPN8/RPN11
MISNSSLLDRIKEHGVETYPEECCGFLLGTYTSDGNEVTSLYRIENRQDENRRRRYLILPDDYRKADKQARSERLEIVGIYHSHPDHPAIPSATDLAEATFPGYTYVIVSILQAQPDALNAWSLAPDRSRFMAEEIQLEASTAKG